MHRPRFSFLLVAAMFHTFVSMTPPLAAAALVAIPDMMPSPLPNAAPVWVAADIAFDHDGALRADFFDQAARASFAGMRRSTTNLRSSTPAGECAAIISGSGPEIRASIDTADDLARNSKAVLRGEVVASRQGFYLGLPGTLFAVNVSERLKNIGGVSNSSAVYIFVDVARIETNGGVICAMPFAPAASIPSVGDRVLLFAVFESPDAAHAIVPVDVTRTLAVQHGEALRAPRSLVFAGAHTIDDVTKLVRANRHLTDAPEAMGGHE